MEFQVDYNPIIYVFIATVLLPVLVSLGIIKYKNGKVYKILLYALIVFVLLYLPILDYWSIWIPNISFWPNEFNTGIASNIQTENVINTVLFSKIYMVLNVSSKVLIFFSIPLFIQTINNSRKYSKKWHQYINWLPFINIFSLTYYLVRLFTKNKMYLFLSIIFFISTLIWVYYLTFATYLIDAGVDSYTILDRIVFKEPYIESNNEYQFSTKIGYDYTYLTDLTSIVTPVFIYISGWTTLVITLKIRAIKKQFANASDKVI